MSQEFTSQELSHGTFKSALIGFVFSIGLTLMAYFLALNKILEGNFLNSILFILGLIQMWVQLHFFLHLGEEAKPQWNLLVFLFMILMTFILVLGTLWIMNNLEYRDMGPMKEDYK